MTRSSPRLMPPGAATPGAGDPTVNDVRHAEAEPSTSVSEQLWHDVHNRLTAFVAQRVDDPADVADLVQTVFLRVHQHMASVADEQRLLPWLFQITRNAIADYYRAPVRRREIGAVAPDGAVELPNARTESSPLQLPDRHSSSDDDSGLRDLAGCVRPLVQLLPPPYREALTLVEFDGVPQVEVASQLGISVSGMKSRVQRGRAMLRDGLLACCNVSRGATGGVLDFAPRSGGSCRPAESSGGPSAEPCQSITPLGRGPSARRTPGGTAGE